MPDYPKMLYKGDQRNFDHATAQDDAHEQVLRDSGWVNYTDLPEREMGVAGGSIGAGALSGSSEFSKDAFVPVEQFDALGEENTKLKEELVEALKNNQELRKQIRFKEVEDMSADDLRKVLDERKIEYGARDGKPVLVNLVLESESTNSAPADQS